MQIRTNEVPFCRFLKPVCRLKVLVYANHRYGASFLECDWLELASIHNPWVFESFPGPRRILRNRSYAKQLNNNTYGCLNSQWQTKSHKKWRCQHAKIRWILHRFFNLRIWLHLFACTWNYMCYSSHVTKALELLRDLAEGDGSTHTYIFWKV